MTDSQSSSRLEKSQDRLNSDEKTEVRQRPSYQVPTSSELSFQSQLNSYRKKRRESFSRNKSAATLQKKRKEDNQYLDDVIKERDSLRTAIQILKQDLSTAFSTQLENKSSTAWQKPKKTAKTSKNSTPPPLLTSNSFNQLSDPEGDVTTKTPGDKFISSKRKSPFYIERPGVNKNLDLHKKSKAVQTAKYDETDNARRVDGSSRSTQETLVLGDSLIKDLRSDLLSKSTKQRVNVKCFRGATSDDMHHYIVPPLRKSRENIIIYVGTNDIKGKSVCGW